MTALVSSSCKVSINYLHVGFPRICCHRWLSSPFVTPPTFFSLSSSSHPLPLSPLVFSPYTLIYPGRFGAKSVSWFSFHSSYPSIPPIPSHLVPTQPIPLPLFVVDRLTPFGLTVLCDLINTRLPFHRPSPISTSGLSLTGLELGFLFFFGFFLFSDLNIIKISICLKDYSRGNPPYWN